MIPKINKEKEYGFLDAWEKSIDNRNLILTSVKSGYSYQIDMFDKNNKLRFYNTLIKSWQPCTYIEPKEIFNSWYLTEVNK